MLKKNHQQKYSKKLPLEYSDLKDFIINLSDFIKLEVLGKGSFGTVWKAQHISNGWIVAIKEFSTISSKNERSASELSNNEQPCSFNEKEFFQEVRILSKCINNPFFVQLVGFSIKSSYAVVTSFIPCGSLWDIFHQYNLENNNERQNKNQKSQYKSQSGLNDTQKTIIALGIAYGMKYLHSQNIIHLDFKSPNILLDDKVLPKIADFGLSQFYNPNSKIKVESIISSEKIGPPASLSQKGTPMWMSPEQICGLRCGPPSDVYSFGVILYELYTGKEPYPGLNQVQIFYKVVRSNERPQLPEANSPISLLISRCWDSDPSKRPTFCEIYDLFQTGQVSFPSCKHRYIRDALKIIEKHEKAVRESNRREAAVLNKAISLRQMRKAFENGEGSGDGSEFGSGSPKYFSSCIIRLAGLGRVKELDVYASALPSLNFNAADDEGMTPIKAAIFNDQLVVVQYLVCLQRVCNACSSLTPDTSVSINSNSNSKINSINNTNNNSNTNTSSNTNSVDTTKDDTNSNVKISDISKSSLLAPSFDINASDSDGNTPFLLAVSLFRPRIVAYLAQVRSVNVNAQNNIGQSALHLMMKLDTSGYNTEQRSIMLKALAFAKNLKVDLKDKEGEMAFDGSPDLLDEFVKRQTANNT